ncbi:hypothetical protein HUT18_12735 [Streptomyces sp. NA04227]|uniref:hypothetical protein n=1 Tax=Streptomyces sp. NA04227 TaxID=2742136 RepID=UPI0015919659|nr:hypothetical protein [Streptomyces sp. NA04227]QKW07137.1 hypothetical protein HUT18_12735 [Streptomyces sp. NA04227]
MSAKRVKIAVTTGALLAVGAVAAPVASAADAPAAATGRTSVASVSGVALAGGGTAPACIERQVHNNADGGTQVWLRNVCGKTMRVKVIVKNWSDSGCRTLNNNTGTFFQTVGGRYDRTVVC